MPIYSEAYKFVHSDIYNSFYNPRGRLSPVEYLFPCDRAAADVAFAVSVFTHMQPPEVRHYIQEAARVLKPGGRLYFTGFVLDDDSEQQIKLGQTTFSFAHQNGACRIESKEEPDMAVAYPLAWIEQTFAEAGFKLQKLETSSWRGRKGTYFQDIVVGIKL